MLSSFKTKINNSSRGFSLLELMVVIAIFAIMTGILVADLPNFREKSSLDLTVSEVATYIRGAQVYGSAQVGAGAGPVSYEIKIDKNFSTFGLYQVGVISAKELYEIKGFKFVNILKRQNGSNSCDINSIKIRYSPNTYTANIGTNLEASFYDVNNTEISGVEYVDIMIKGNRNPNLSGCLRVYQNGQIVNVACEFSDC